MEYYDEETLEMAKKEEYNFCYYKYELFMLPFSHKGFVCTNLPLEKQKIYRNGDCALEFDCYDTEAYFKGEASINYYHRCYCESYSKIINDFLTIILIKGLYIGRTLNKEEIAKVRTKFIELYKSGYDFEYYEDELFNLEYVKVYKKSIEK